MVVKEILKVLENSSVVESVDEMIQLTEDVLTHLTVEKRMHVQEVEE